MINCVEVDADVGLAMKFLDRPFGLKRNQCEKSFVELISLLDNSHDQLASLYHFKPRPSPVPISSIHCSLSRTPSTFLGCHILPVSKSAHQAP